ncbi:glucuronyl esterase domain-containing protein [Streptomyces achromogenes]|uniref:glucuronyl esterase domain-containing protein n=1 Tax=Streptomyces achromogenes TaxID=67255 RepID=UPI00367E085C
MRPDRSRRHRPGLLVTTALTGAVALVGTTPHEARPATVTAAPAGYGVEDDGADCPVPATGQTPSRALLPDPFLKLDGTRVTTASDWRCRRAEIRELAERTVYGRKPPKPARVSGTVSATTITVNVGDQGRSAGFSARVELPGGSGPFPVVIVYGGLGADTGTIKASGVAVITYDPYTVGKEGTSRGGKQGAFYSLYGSSSTTGLLMAWSWGVSRIIDVIEQSGGTILKAGATGVTGCSRFGKGAFVAGAFDQRIALTMPVESGTGGVPAYRSIPGESGAQPLSSAYAEQPWLGDAFGPYTGNPNALPVDTHEIVGMVAPRGLFIMENPYVDWLGARSGSVAALGGAEIYKALGAGGDITYWSDVRDGTHCAVRPEWKTPLQQNLSRFLLGSGSGSGVFRTASGKAGDLARWRDWQTPVLTGVGGAGSATGAGAGGASATGAGAG